MRGGNASGAAVSQSDEEYLSPQEEAMELGESPAPSKRVHFKEPPLFQVGTTNQLKTGKGGGSLEYLALSSLSSHHCLSNTPLNFLVACLIIFFKRWRRATRL